MQWGPCAGLELHFLPALGEERGAGEKVARRWAVPLAISPLSLLDRRVTYIEYPPLSVLVGLGASLEETSLGTKLCS